MAIRLLSLLCLLYLGFTISVEKMHFEGMMLCRLQNLPHRGLGLLFWCQTLEPQRADYVRDYLVQYFIYDGNEMLLEGQTRPVVPCYAVVMARRFPHNKELQIIREITMRNHFNKLENQKHENRVD